MGIGINGLLNIGNNALRASQVAINVTGNNVANVNTIGYSRQSVLFQESRPINTYPGQMGNGAYVHEIYRNFDRFLENSFLDQNSQASMWNEKAAIMSSVQSVFNESNTSGVHNQMSEFFGSWSDLAKAPDNLATREALLSQADNLTRLLQDTTRSLDRTKAEMDLYINQSVDAVNEIIDQLAKVNKEIGIQHHPPQSSANTLLDERDRLVRELGTYVDVRVQDNGPHDFKVYLKEGMPLVEGSVKYSISNNAPYYENDTKNFTGELVVEGEDHNEYIFEFVSGSEFKVSIDGGKTWATDSSGKSTFTVPPVGEKLQVGDLKISFKGGGYLEGETPVFDEGDQFYVVPKDSIKWHEPTRGPVGVSQSVNMETIGGKLGAYLDARDAAIGKYQAELDALAESLIWEVNRIHSQGSGTDPFTGNTGTTKVEDTNLALGSPWQNIAYSDRLTSGSLNMHFFGDDGKPLITPKVLNFNTTPGGAQENFDPEKHSLNDVVDAINRTYVDAAGAPLVTASISNGQIQLVAGEDVNYKMGSDSTGLWAALGVNTFFAGDNASNISVNPHLADNPGHVNAHAIDGADEGEEGDNSIATLISKLATEGVNISTAWSTTNESVLDYYAGTIGSVGADTRNARFNAKYYGTLATELGNQALSKTGVNLDEEMLLLIKFQHSYTAAAKLITTADEMFQTLLGLKP